MFILCNVWELWWQTVTWMESEGVRPAIQRQSVEPGTPGERFGAESPSNPTHGSEAVSQNSHPFPDPSSVDLVQESLTLRIVG